MIELLKEIIIDFQHETRFAGIKRELSYDLVKQKAFVCIGVRRCGKSTLLYQIIESLCNQGVRPENILYINFFDDRLTQIRQGQLSLIMEAYFSLYPDKKGSETIWCFFDEIQEAQNWESFIDRLLRTENCFVFITGSSAKLLSKEVATQMRGRSLVWELFPFSFKEFLAYKKTDFQPLTSRNRHLLQHAFDEYFRKGGFPEVSDTSDRIRTMILQEYYKSILHRDIIERFNVIHPRAVIQAGYRLIGSVGSFYSLNRITGFLKSLEFKTSKTFVASCTEWFEDAFFLFSVRLFSSSAARQNANVKKIYCIDHALAASVASGITSDKGHFLENIVFVHLRHRTDRIYYYRTEKGLEVDFIWLDEQNNRHLVQVCFSLKEASTRRRETTALLQAMEEQKMTDSVIVTMDEEELISEDGRIIRIIPAWKYLLGI